MYWLQVEVSQFGSTCTNMSDSFKITVHAPPAKPTLYANPSPGCENQSPVTLAAYNVAGYPISVQWSNGAIGDSTNVNTKGVYVATVVDSFGCTNEASIEVYGVPEMCYFMCGCYEFCDTAQGGIWLPGIPGNYASWAWYANGWGAFSSGSGIIQPLDLIAVGGGEVYLVVTNNQGCTDTSCLFEYTLIPCEYSEPMEPCGGDWYGEKVECIDNSPYNYTYILSFNYNWSGCNGSMITNVSSNFGSTSGFSGGMLNSGANSLSGFITFNTPFPPIGQVCLTFTVWDPCTNMHCTFQVCFEDWDCDQMIAPDEVIRIKNAFELPHSKNPDDSNQDQGDNDLRIFPNPTNGLVNLWYRCQNESGCKIEIQNNQGVTIRRVDLPNSSSEIIFNENEFPAGAYSFHLYDGHKHLLQKVIIMK